MFKKKLTVDVTNMTEEEAVKATEKAQKREKIIYFTKVGLGSVAVFAALVVCSATLAKTKSNKELMDDYMTDRLAEENED